MLRKALSLKRFPYKSGCTCSEKKGRLPTFALLCPRLGGNAPNFVATTSKSSTSCAMKRWMRRKLDSLEALLPNAPTSLDKQTVCTVQSAPSGMERHLMWARFIDALKIGRITVKISLLLCETLMLRDMVIMW